MPINLSQASIRRKSFLRRFFPPDWKVEMYVRMREIKPLPDAPYFDPSSVDRASYLVVHLPPGPLPKV